TRHPCRTRARPRPARRRSGRSNRARLVRWRRARRTAAAPRARSRGSGAARGRRRRGTPRRRVPSRASSDRTRPRHEGPPAGRPPRGRWRASPFCGREHITALRAGREPLAYDGRVSLLKRRGEIALALASLVMGLGLAEAGARMLGAGSPRASGYAPVNTRRRGMSPTNARGYRDNEHPTAKPAGVRRLLSLGDSFAWGAGVEFEDAYPQRLPRGLSPRPARPR